jgi:hypothetical protein
MNTFDMEKMIESPDEYEIREKFRGLSMHQRMAFLFFFAQRKNNEMTEFNVSQSNRPIQVINPTDENGYRIGDYDYYNANFSAFGWSSQQDEDSFESDGVKWTGKDGYNCCVCGDDEAFEVEGVTTTQFEINGIKIVGYKCIDCHSDNKRLCSSAFKGEPCKREIIKDNTECLLMCLNEWGIPKDVVGVIGGSVVDVACCV